jgi:hypothetical protein
VHAQALTFIGLLYDIEREVVPNLSDEPCRIYQEKARFVADALHTWMTEPRQKLSAGSAIAKGLDCRLKRRLALTRYLGDGDLPIDNNWAASSEAAVGC